MVLRGQGGTGYALSLDAAERANVIGKERQSVYAGEQQIHGELHAGRADRCTELLKQEPGLGHGIRSGANDVKCRLRHHGAVLQNRAEQSLRIEFGTRHHARFGATRKIHDQSHGRCAQAGAMRQFG